MSYVARFIYIHSFSVYDHSHFLMVETGAGIYCRFTIDGECSIMLHHFFCHGTIQVTLVFPQSHPHPPKETTWFFSNGAFAQLAKFSLCKEKKDLVRSRRRLVPWLELGGFQAKYLKTIVKLHIFVLFLLCHQLRNVQLCLKLDAVPPTKRKQGQVILNL